MKRVIFCVFSAKDEEVYTRILPDYFPPSEEDLSAAKEQDDSDSDFEGEPGRHWGWSINLSEVDKWSS